MKKDIYIYPSVLTYYEENIGIEFPDLTGCVSNANNIEEVSKCAKEVLALHLFGMEEDRIEIPQPSSIENIKLEKHQTLLLVEVYMPLYRDAIENSYVSKNVTLPLWLKKIAEENKINFSQVLQSALKEKLNIKN